MSISGSLPKMKHITQVNKERETNVEAVETSVQCVVFFLPANDQLTRTENHNKNHSRIGVMPSKSCIVSNQRSKSPTNEKNLPSLSVIYIRTKRKFVLVLGRHSTFRSIVNATAHHRFSPASDHKNYAALSFFFWRIKRTVSSYPLAISGRHYRDTLDS